MLLTKASSSAIPSRDTVVGWASEHTGGFVFDLSDYQEQHYVPFVDAMISTVLPDERRVMVTLPRGLLQLGRQQLRLDLLRTELKPYLTRPVNNLRARLHGQLVMPTVQQLREAGRADLVALIAQAGGAQKVRRCLACAFFTRRLFTRRLVSRTWTDTLSRCIVCT